MPTIRLVQAHHNDLLRLNHFLKVNGEQRASRGDLNFILEEDKAIIGCARLIPIDSDIYWLRGVFIIEERRQQGLGTYLINQVHQHIDRQQTVFAFPYQHLEHFYKRLGYEFCDQKELPDELQQRYLSAQRQNKAWLLMKRELAR